MTEQDFSECVIVPIKLFSKCKFEKSKTDILDHPVLHPDVKVKLFHQKNKMGKVKHLEEQKTFSRDLSAYLDEFSVGKRPLAKSIFEYLVQNPNTISWNDDFEISINDQYFPMSNVVKLVQYVLGEIIMTSERDKPQGADSFVRALNDIGVPKEWMKIPQPKLRVRRRLIPAVTSPPNLRKRRSTQQLGQGWISL